jgi:hypothetical protein
LRTLGSSIAVELDVALSQTRFKHYYNVFYPISRAME